MATYSRPGVFINEIPLPQINEPADNGTAYGTFIGAFPKGPVEPTLVSSWTEFVKLFGKPNSSFFAPTAVYSFFANGGRNAYIVRSTGSLSGETPIEAASASVVLVDEDDEDTIKISAKTPGDWANSVLSIRIAYGVVDGDETLFSVLVFESISGVNQLVEQFNDLSMDVDSSRYFEGVVNSGSRYIKAERLTYTGLIPVESGSSYVALTGGASAVDDAVESTGTVKRVLLLADYEDALALLDTIPNPLVINLPDVAYYFEQGDTSSFETDQAEIYTALLAYVEERTDAFAVIDVPKGSTVTEALEFASLVKSVQTGSNAAVYYPWLVIPDNSRGTTGATKTIAPGAAVVGQYLATDASRGVFKTPAGLSNVVAQAVATERKFTNAELDSLNSSSVPVNAIRNVPGSGIVIMGGRTLRNVPGDRYINARRSLIYIKKELESLSSFAVFENNSTRLWNRLTSTLGAFLLDYWANGGLRGNTPQQAFYVKCDSTTTTEADILNGQVNIEVGVALEYPAEFVVINIGQITGSASF